MAATVVSGTSRLEQLPLEILILILLNLDFATVCSCRLLCKTIANSISTLINDHASFAQRLVENTPVSFVIHTKGSRMANYRVCIDDFERTTELRDHVYLGGNMLRTINVTANLPVSTEGISNILGSCNGLLLMRNIDSGDYLYVCNPLLGECVQVPPCTMDYTLFDNVFGLCFDPMTNRHAVLRISCYRFKKPEAEIQILGTDTWTSIGDDPLYPATKRIDDVRLNGALHWVTFGADDNLSICSFHVKGKKFKKINPPCNLKDSQRGGFQSFALGVLWDCLCICEKININADDDAPHMYVWIMKKYGDENSWIKKLSVSKIWIHNSGRPFSSPELQPISRMKNGEMLMLCWGSSVVCFNPVTEKFRCINFEEDVAQAYPWVPSFDSIRG